MYIAALHFHFRFFFVFLSILDKCRSRMGHDSSPNKAECLPPNFVYSADDKFYYGPATCEFLHYRWDNWIAQLMFENILDTTHFWESKIHIYKSSRKPASTIGETAFLLAVSRWHIGRCELRFYCIHFHQEYEPKLWNGIGWPLFRERINGIGYASWLFLSLRARTGLATKKQWC